MIYDEFAADDNFRRPARPSTGIPITPSYMRASRNVFFSPVQRFRVVFRPVRHFPISPTLFPSRRRLTTIGFPSNFGNSYERARSGVLRTTRTAGAINPSRDGVSADSRVFGNRPLLVHGPLWWLRVRYVPRLENGTRQRAPGFRYFQ